jgi:hypothetical protein
MDHVMQVNAEHTLKSCLWYGANLKGDQAREEYMDVVRREFADAMGAAGHPDGACLIVEGTSGDELAMPVEVVPSHRRVFFSPEAISHVPHLIVRYGATPCGAPPRDGTKLLFGVDDDWGRLRRDSH